MNDYTKFSTKKVEEFALETRVEHEINLTPELREEAREYMVDVYYG